VCYCSLSTRLSTTTPEIWTLILLSLFKLTADLTSKAIGTGGVGTLPADLWNLLFLEVNEDFFERPLLNNADLFLENLEFPSRDPRESFNSDLVLDLQDI